MSNQNEGIEGSNPRKMSARDIALTWLRNISFFIPIHEIIKYSFSFSIKLPIVFPRSTSLTSYKKNSHRPNVVPPKSDVLVNFVLFPFFWLTSHKFNVSEMLIRFFPVVYIYNLKNNIFVWENIESNCSCLMSIQQFRIKPK